MLFRENILNGQDALYNLPLSHILGKKILAIALERGSDYKRIVIRIIIFAMNEKGFPDGFVIDDSKRVRQADFLNGSFNTRQFHSHLADADITELVENLSTYDAIEFVDLCDSLSTLVLLIVRINIDEYVGINKGFSYGHWLPPGQT
jgi:hypothetical protein